MNTPGYYLRRSVTEYRSAGTTEERREEIRVGWAADGIPNQFAAMVRAAELDRAEEAK